MAGAEAVAGLPGGEQFEALWHRVDGDAGSVSALAAALMSAAEHVGSVQTYVSTSVGGLEGGWNGSAADAFGAYMGKMSAASADVTAGLDKAAAALTQAAAEIDSAKATLDSIANQILDEAEKVKDIPILGATLAAEAVSRGCAEAEPAVQALSAQLSAAASGVSSALATGGYRTLPAPGEGSYLPSHGGAIDWTAVPKDGEGDATSPASADSGNSGGSGGGGSTDGSGAGSGTGSNSFAGGSGSVGSGGGPPAAQPTGDVKTWIDEATKILEEHGVSADKISAADINMIISHESSGNPHAINLTDSNAAAGHPSKGVMQCIDSTFDANALPGHTDIWNPVDNIIAGVRYALGRYGSLDNVPGVRAVHDGGSYVGY